MGIRRNLIYEENVRIASGIQARDDVNVFEEFTIFSTIDGEYYNDDSKHHARIETSQCIEHRGINAYQWYDKAKRNIVKRRVTAKRLWREIGTNSATRRSAQI